MHEGDDALIGPRLRIAQLDHLRLDAQRIAMEYRTREAHLVPAEIGDRGAERGIADGNADHQSQREHRIDQPLAVFGGAHVLLVEVQLRGIVRHRRENDVVGLGHGAPDGVLKHLPDMKLFEP